MPLEDMILEKETKKVLVAMSHKVFQGIVTTVETANIGLRIVSLKERYKVNLPLGKEAKALLVCGPQGIL